METETNVRNHYIMKGAFTAETIVYFIPCGLAGDGSFLFRVFFLRAACVTIFSFNFTTFPRGTIVYARYRHECHVPREANWTPRVTNSWNVRERRTAIQRLHIKTKEMMLSAFVRRKFLIFRAERFGHRASDKSFASAETIRQMEERFSLSTHTLLKLRE